MPSQAIVRKTLSWKYPTPKRTGGVAQREYLPSNHETVSSNPYTVPSLHTHKSELFLQVLKIWIGDWKLSLHPLIKNYYTECSSLQSTFSFDHLKHTEIAKNYNASLTLSYCKMKISYFPCTEINTAWLKFLNDSKIFWFWGAFFGSTGVWI
jgi:hypothetical protein